MDVYPWLTQVGVTYDLAMGTGYSVRGHELAVVDPVLDPCRRSTAPIDTQLASASPFTAYSACSHVMAASRTSSRPSPPNSTNSSGGTPFHSIGSPLSASVVRTVEE